MNSATKLSIAAAALAMGFAAHAAEPQPSVVIVHGAFADGSDWAKVIPLLQAKGVRVTAVQNPLTSLDDDVAAAKRAIDAAPGKVVLVGHSWGGTVITQAGANDKVASLVYIAAFAPDVGQAVGELGKAYPAPAGLSHLVPDAAGFLRLSDEGMSKHFAQDLPAAQTAVMAATQGPIAGKAFGEKVSVAAWKSKPSWYLVAANDHMIQPALQRDFAKLIGAKVSEVKTSHVPQQSAPAQVAATILDAVKNSQ
ncbi:pimeloyl-ACP methyl ester carboxylesterase [Pelomonas saccharophila]|uniref:Pimeloyl-ACP methyl ester carboxylesterase n=1 Tax=Roseateles saccharophilus TaxID=304 RepID=A0ABU1YKQ7_ROSSA|nr:alpha/beta hydrolase [Roseateles saccharophilus]MDR7269437.1 pimeloyl-ACP methyl ester carboxylesterase [Roseateles saccharophilus]